MGQRPNWEKTVEFGKGQPPLAVSQRRGLGKILRQAVSDFEGFRVVTDDVRRVL
jgi:hypothetical protein